MKHKFPTRILRLSETYVAMSADLGSKPPSLSGQEEANIDDKGRVLFSKKKRDILGEDFVMRLGDNGCIFAYSAEEWELTRSEINSFPRTNQGRHMYTRLVNGTAVVDLNFDGQGRVVIPRMLRDMAKIKDRVVIIGCEERAEIWAAEELAKHDIDPAGYGKERKDLINEARRQMMENR